MWQRAAASVFLTVLCTVCSTQEVSECHCLTGCTSNFTCTTGGCSPGWSGPTCQRENIARGRPAHQSSTLDDSTMCPDYNWAICGLKSADLAVDGDTWADRASNYWKGSCSHTNITNANSAWWRVNLGSVHRISLLGIFRPTNWRSNERTTSTIFDFRMRGFRVLVDGQTCYNHSVGIKTPPFHLVTCKRPLYGSEVKIVLPPGSQGIGGEYLISLCEVEVYECSNMWFGQECDKTCNCRDHTEVCDSVTGMCTESGCKGDWSGPSCKDCTGQVNGADCITMCGHCRSGDLCTTDDVCPHGCDDGWTGPTCSECVNRRFGAACNKFCNCRDAVEVCDKSTGRCYSSGCADGWTGTNCLSHCPNGTYGFQCNGRCGHCAGGDVCHRVTGVCSGGCQDGWTGDTCHECQDFHFGPECSGKCRCRNTQEVCDKATGSCYASGCELGYAGIDCQTECRDWSFGADCKQRCGSCQGGAVCMKNNGTCPGGCLTGRKPPLCQGCVDGFFGVSCDRMCGHCKNSTTCAEITGDCPFGCMSGWRGKRCTTECEYGFYGDECTGSCGHCSYVPCNPETGRCLRGCQTGYSGDLCLNYDPKILPISQGYVRLSTGAIIAISLGVLLAAIIPTTTGLCIWMVRSRRRKRRAANTSTVVFDRFHTPPISLPQQPSSNAVRNSSHDGGSANLMFVTGGGDSLYNNQPTLKFKNSTQSLSVYKAQQTLANGEQSLQNSLKTGMNGVKRSDDGRRSDESGVFCDDGGEDDGSCVADTCCEDNDLNKTRAQGYGCLPQTPLNIPQSRDPFNIGSFTASSSWTQNSFSDLSCRFCNGLRNNGRCRCDTDLG